MSEINEIIGRRKPYESSLKSGLSLDGINEFFCTVTVSKNHQPASSYVLPDTPSCIGVADTFRFQPIQLSEVLSALKGLDTRKSAGSNGIPVFFNTR